MLPSATEENKTERSMSRSQDSLTNRQIAELTDGPADRFFTAVSGSFYFKEQQSMIAPRFHTFFRIRDQQTDEPTDGLIPSHRDAMTHLKTSQYSDGRETPEPFFFCLASCVVCIFF